MTDIFDALKKAAFGDIEFPYTDLKIRGSLRHHVHEYLHRPGAEIESLGRRAYEFRYGCQFHTDMPSWPDLYPDRLSQLVSLCESEQTLALYVPNLAREIQAKAIEWPRTLLASVRSGEQVEFAFIEDASDRYTADKLIGLSLSSAPTQFEIVRVAVEALEDEVSLDLLDLLSAELDAWLAVVESVQLQAEYQHARIDGLFNRCNALARAPILQTAPGSAALRATLDLWATIAKLRNDSLVAARPLAAYVTQEDRLSVVDVSLRLFGSPAYALEILQLNDFDDALSIKLGTNVRYLVAA
jgi:hypothetical protein